MSAYGDAFAITPQRSLPREKVAEMLEHIFQLNEEYEERKEIEDNPAYWEVCDIMYESVWGTSDIISEMPKI